MLNRIIAFSKYESQLKVNSCAHQVLGLSVQVSLNLLELNAINIYNYASTPICGHFMLTLRFRASHSKGNGNRTLRTEIEGEFKGGRRKKK